MICLAHEITDRSGATTIDVNRDGWLAVVTNIGLSNTDLDTIGFVYLTQRSSPGAPSRNVNH